MREFGGWTGWKFLAFAGVLAGIVLWGCVVIRVTDWIEEIGSR